MLTRFHPTPVAVSPSQRHAFGVPPGFVEYGYYGSILYALLAPALGLSVELLGAALLAVLAAVCILSVGPRALTFYARLRFPLGCALSLVVLQMLFHNESLFSENVRPFITWILALIIIQSLSLRREFLSRFGLAAFLIGLTLLPYLKMNYAGGPIDRAGLDRSVGLANPNDFAAWFGFCALYFVIVGIETPRIVVRVAAWLTAVGCLYLVGITVSRGTLIAFAIASIVALRRSLKRGFLPLLSLCVLGWLLYLSDLFAHIVESYTARATVESGRLQVWPLALERFLQAPLVGVGVSHLYTYLPLTGRAITPHNGFLYVALASGIIPLTLFVGYWWRAACGVARAQRTPTPETPFYLPLLIYAFLATMEGNLSFMAPWGITALALALAADHPSRVRHVVVRRRARHGSVQRDARRSSDALAPYPLQPLRPNLEPERMP